MDLLNKLEMPKHKHLEIGLRGNAPPHIPQNKGCFDVFQEFSEDIYRIWLNGKDSISLLPAANVCGEEAEEQNSLVGHLSRDEAVSLPPLKLYLDTNVGSDVGRHG